LLFEGSPVILDILVSVEYGFLNGCLLWRKVGVLNVASSVELLMDGHCDFSRNLLVLVGHHSWSHVGLEWEGRTLSVLRPELPLLILLPVRVIGNLRTSTRGYLSINLGLYLITHASWNLNGHVDILGEDLRRFLLHALLMDLA
jgi:hypothetical protein